MWEVERVIDADGHVMEPLWLWRDYLDPAFRDRGLRVLRDANDGDKLLIDGAPSRLIRRLGGVVPREGQKIPDWNHLPCRPHFASYEESCTVASWQGPARLEWLDKSGIDATFLFPSLGLIWPREADPVSPYAVAHFDAYNRWVRDMAADSTGRLIPVAQIAHTDSVSADLTHLAEVGFRHVMLPMGVGQSLRGVDAFFAAAQDFEFVVHLHKVAIPHLLPTASPTDLRTAGAGAFYNHVNEVLPGQLLLAALLDDRVLDRFPRLRFAFHECGAGWLPAWLDRARESWETLRSNRSSDLPEHPPSDYFTDADRIFFSVGLGEDLAATPGWLRRRSMLATDYPHPGTPACPASSWTRPLRPLPISDANAVAAGNAARLISAKGG
ncbi:amidohydrolase family protein [Actinocorallia herbida]|uniref:Amidohydrolase family protein n=1 Tax=Actinocorallia herbida TaxID=58109 RepID=A0A3N1CNP3_9ACTN|nr:amidohydrolase family protein [Actinocorallia herbida]ROO82936.1 amidohydrolase family protein [Actinocorallia herbida]